MTYLLTFDPGMSTGITLGSFTEDDGPYIRQGYWQIEGGLAALREWWDNHYSYDDGWYFSTQERPLTPYWADMTYVCEKFVPLPAPRTFKTAELEPIRIEGMIEDRLDGNVVWQRASAMVLAGGDTPAQRKRASDDVLRRMGLWTTGKQVGCKDANDVNSAQKHAIAYLRSIGHAPTIEALKGE